MNKEKLRAYIWIGIFSILLGVIISFQVKVVQNKLLDGVLPSMRSKELILELETVNQKKTALENEVILLEEELTKIKDSVSQENALIDSLSRQLELYKKFAGMTKVMGQGIEITIDNSKDEFSTNNNNDNNIVHEYNLILNLINELNAAGAEAISIGGQRLVNTTEIRTAGDTLMVNKTPLYAPIEIKAIGNSKTLNASISQRFGIVSIIRDKGFFIEINQSEKVIIEKYDKLINFDYINDYED